MKMKQYVVISSLCLFGALAQAANVEAQISRSTARVGEHMATVTVAISDQDPNLERPYNVRLRSKSGLTFTPNRCQITQPDDECYFTVSGNDQTKPGADAIRVKSNNAKNTRLRFNVIAADAERLRFPDFGTDTVKNGQVMAGVNGGLLTYSVDGGQSFKHSALPAGATSVRNIKIAGNNNAARVYVNYEGSADVTEIKQKNGRVIRTIAAPAGASKVSMVEVANTHKNRAQKLILYKNTPTVRLIKKNGAIVDIAKPASVPDWYNLAVPAVTKNGGFVIRYASQQMSGLHYAKDVLLVRPNAKHKTITGPNDAKAAGSIRNLQVSSTEKGLVVLGYNGPTVTVVNRKGKQRYETGVSDALSVYQLNATQNNQVLVSYYKRFGYQTWEGHSNHLKLINANGHARGNGSSVDIAAPEGTSDGFASMGDAGQGTLVTFYRQAYYRVNDDGTDAEYRHTVRPEALLIDAKGNVSELNPPAGATELHKAEQGGQARLMSYEGTTDMLLIKPDSSIQTIPALSGAKGIRWVTGSEQGNFLVTLTESETQTGQANTLPEVQWIASTGETKAIEGQQRVVSGSCSTSRKLVDIVYAADGYNYSYVYETVKTCDYEYESEHPVDTPVAANGNFLIRYYGGDAVTLVKPDSETVSIDGYHKPNWVFAEDGSMVLYNMGELTAKYVSADGDQIKDIQAPRDHQLMYIGDVINSDNNFLVLYAKQSDYKYDYAPKNNVWLDKQGNTSVVNGPKQSAFIPAWISDHSLFIKRDWAAPTGSGQFNIRYSRYGENLDNPDNHETQVITNQGAVIHY